MRFGEYIRRLRETKGLTLSAAARELGMSPQRLSDIELGRRNYTRAPAAALLSKMAAIYDHPLASLVMNSEFYQYEKAVVSQLLDDLVPSMSSLEALSLSILVESKRYTPEMEEQAQELVKAVGNAKTAILVAQSQLRVGRRREDPGT